MTASRVPLSAPKLGVWRRKWDKKRNKWDTGRNKWDMVGELGRLSGMRSEGVNA